MAPKRRQCSLIPRQNSAQKKPYTYCTLYTCSLIHVSFMNLSPFQCSNRIPHRWSHYPTLCLISSTPLPPIPLSPIPPFHCLTALLSPYLIPLEPSHQTTPHPSLITHTHTQTHAAASKHYCTPSTLHPVQPYILYKVPPQKKKRTNRNFQKIQSPDVLRVGRMLKLIFCKPI